MADNPKNTNQQPDIVIQNTGVGISKQDFEDHKRDFDFQKNISTWTFGLSIAVVLICFLSFVTFIIDSYKFHSDTTIDFNNTIKELKKENSDLKLESVNEKIEALTKELKDLKASQTTKQSLPQTPVIKKTN